MHTHNNHDDPNRITYIGTTDYRGINTKFGIKANDRTRHMYVIGKTGMGKSTLLENMAVQDIQNGEGLCFLDPHGSSAETLLKYIPEHRVNDVVYFAPFDIHNPIALNVLEKVSEDQRHLVSNGLMAAFKKIFGADRFSDRMEYLLNNIILALLENEDQTLLGVNRMLSDKGYRDFIVSNVKDPAVKAFWTEELVRAGDKYLQEAAPAIQNKIGQFISNPLIRNVVGQKKTSFDIRKMMDEKKILICNFSIGRMGEGNVNLLGNLINTKIYLAALSRANLPHDELKKSANFYFYVDEFQNFVNESFAQILSQARKYNLGLTVAHQYIEQLSDEVKAAVFGNVGSMMLFRVGADDAEKFEKEFSPQFTMDDIVNLGFSQIYLRLSIDGAGSKPFSAKTLPPIAKHVNDYTDAVIAASRRQFTKPKADAEIEVMEFYDAYKKPAYIPKALQNDGASNSGAAFKSGNSNDNKPNYKSNSEYSAGGMAKSYDNNKPREHSPNYKGKGSAYAERQQAAASTTNYNMNKVNDNGQSESQDNSKARNEAQGNIKVTNEKPSGFKSDSEKPSNNLRDALNKALGVHLESQKEKVKVENSIGGNNVKNVEKVSVESKSKIDDTQGNQNRRSSTDQKQRNYNNEEYVANKSKTNVQEVDENTLRDLIE